MSILSLIGPGGEVLWSRDTRDPELRRGLWRLWWQQHGAEVAEDDGWVTAYCTGVTP